MHLHCENGCEKAVFEIIPDEIISMYGKLRCCKCGGKAKDVPECSCLIDSPSPAWHARPTSPGWWVVTYKGKRKMGCLQLSDIEVKEWSDGYEGAVYGPIPEPPEMPT